MKKVLFGIGMVAALIAAPGTKTGGSEVEPGLYPNVGYVTEIDEESDIVYWNDGENLWSFYGIEDWMIGDGVAVIMSDEGTESVKDDRMVTDPRYWNAETVTLGYWGEK